MHIIHGDNTILSYKKLILLQEEYLRVGRTIISLDPSSLTLTQLRQELSPQDLFGNSNLIVISNLLSSAKSAKKEKILDFLESQNSDSLILYEGKAINLNSLRRFKGAKVETFKLETYIFKFLDLLKPGNTRNIISGYTKLVAEGSEPEYIFAMILRQVRLLIQTKTKYGGIKISPYAKKYLDQQASLFSLDKLLELHSKLYQIELGVKSGSNPINFESLLENFLQNL